MRDDGLIRVNIRISPEVHHDLTVLIPWGMRRHVLETVLRLVLDAVRADGRAVLGSVLDGQFKLVRSDTETIQNWDGGR